MHVQSYNSGGFILDNLDRRSLRDRRKQPTPGLSRFTFLGQRRTFRRKADQERGGYIDRYNTGLFLLLIFIIGLNILDTVLTMMIMEYGGWELNPIARSIIEIYGDRFWIWKFTIVSISLVLLCLHSKFRRIQTIIIAACSVYAGVVLYQISLIIHYLIANPR